MSKSFKVVGMDKKEVDSEHHTLFVEDIVESRIAVKDRPHQYIVTPPHRLFRVFISSFSERKKGLHAVFNELRKAEPYDQLELRINSGGGLVTEGKQFFNIILEKFGHKTTTFLDNYGYSMGALLFCMGHRRVVYPYSALMFHNYSHGSWGKGENVRSHVKHTSRTLKSFFRDLTVKQGFLTDKEFKEMLLGKDFWMDTEEMCRRGIATHVVINGKELTAKRFLKFLKEREKQDNKSLKKGANKKHKEGKKKTSKKRKKSRKVIEITADVIADTTSKKK